MAIELAPPRSALMRFGANDPERLRSYLSMLAAYLAAKSPNTRSTYRTAIKQFFELFDWISPQDVEQVHAAGFKLWLVERRGYSDATAYTRMSAVSSFFDYLCTPVGSAAEPLLKYNPFKHVSRSDIQPSPYQRSRPMAWSTFELIMDSIPSDAMGLRDQAILLFFAFTGRRRQEVAQLRVGDLNLTDDPPWYEARVKGNKLQRFELPKLCLDAIRAYWIAADRSERHPDEGVFCPLENDHLTADLDPLRPLSNRSMNEILARAARRAGLDPADPSICLHALRHMSARDLDEGGARLQDIQRFLGHASPATTDIYLGALKGPAPAMTDTLVEVRRNAAKRFAEVIDSD